MNCGLLNSQLLEIIDIISSYSEIDEAVIFGSRAVNTFKKASDVDIALKGKKVTVSLATQLKYHLEEDTYLPFFFDVIDFKSIHSEELKNHIMDKGSVIFCRSMSETIL